jgi:hypothetical protein
MARPAVLELEAQHITRPSPCTAEAPSGKRDDLERHAETLLQSFKYAARGRRGSSPRELTESEWWALGQHYGLATPLLDWTWSPFAAAYFAFEEPDDAHPTDYRSVYGLFRVSYDTDPLGAKIPALEFVNPLSDDNDRLLSQSGLFTRLPIGMTVEDWVRRASRGYGPILYRIDIPNCDRLRVLDTLNLMNINRRTLFPDLGGAAQYATFEFARERPSRV